MAGRERLGRRVAFSHREQVYAARDCFEIDEVEGYDVTRKRVFYDDVVLVTCACCDASWLAVHDELERILVGPED